MRIMRQPPIRIIHITSGLTSGGAEWMLYRLLRATDRTLFTPHVISLTGLDQIGPRIEDLGIRVTALGVSRANPNPLSIMDVTRAIRAFRPEVIQTWMYHADLMGGIAARFNDSIPVAWGLHHTDHAPGSTSHRTRLVIRSCARLSSYLPQRIICCSNATLAVHAEIGYDRSRMLVIPNGFDISIFRPESDARNSLRRELGVPEDTQLVAMLGRYHPQKDHRNFLDAARILAAGAPRAHFVLCGDEVDWNNRELVDLVTERGIRDRVHLLGQRDDVPRILAALDAGSTSASHGEAFPLVIGETMACGVPCVVTDVGDSALIVGDTGIVVPPRAPEALAAGWLKLLELTPDEHIQLGAEARTRVEENFEIGKIAGRFADVHQELVGSRRAKAHTNSEPPRPRVQAENSAACGDAESGASAPDTGDSASTADAVSTASAPGAGRIALVANTSWYICNFRGAMIRRLVSDGWRVHVLAPDTDHEQALRELGAEFELWRINRRSMNPFANLAGFARIFTAYRRIRPDVVHHFTIKPVLLGGIAARLLRIRGIVQSVTGLGHAFASSALIHATAGALYRIALGGRAVTIFQNADDMRQIVALGATDETRAVLIPGSGVDLERFEGAREPLSCGAPMFVMACRMLWPKGVREFIEASDIVAAAHPAARFILLGDSDPGAPDTVPRDWLRTNSDARPHVEWPGFQSDVAPYIRNADVIVLPSYYNEGLPKTLLEGAAAGRPLIAADNRGSRDIVKDGTTGILVPPRDPAALADAMMALLDDPDSARAMGRAGRALVEREFSLEQVIDRTLDVYDRVLGRRIKVVHIITGLLVGGAEHMLGRFLGSVDRERFAPEVVSLRDEGELGSWLESLDIPVHCLRMEPGRLNVRGFFRLVRLLRRIRPDVVQTWLYHADFVGGVAARFAGSPPVAWNIRHSFLDPETTSDSLLWIVRICARFSRTLPAAIVTNSEKAMEHHVELGYDAGRMTLIPNGFDLEAFRPDPTARMRMREEIGIPPHAIVITSAGRYHPVKDHAGLLEAAGILLKSHPDVHFVLCGRGVSLQEPTLVELTERHGVAGNAHLLGSRTDLPMVFAGSDIFTSSSHGESFPQVLGEAMASGIPCVVTDVGDSASIVSDTGLVVPSGDPAAMAAAWRKLIDVGVEERERLGAAARKRVGERYDISKAVARFEQLHARLAGREEQHQD